MSESDYSINLQNESAELLEAVGKQLRSKWLGHIAREISISVVASIALLVGIGYFAGVQFEWAQEGQGAVTGLGDAIVLDAIKAPKSFLHLMAIGFFCLFLLYFVYSFFANIIRLFSGPPKAGRTPEQTIENYFMTLVPTNLNRHDWVDAYVCLLDQCKDSFGDYDHFISFWKEAKKALTEQIAEHFKPRTVSNTTWTLGECRVETDVGDGIKEYEVNLKVDAEEGINNPGLSSAKDIGTVIVTARVPLVKVGERWYVANKEYNPQLGAAKGSTDD